MVLRKLTLALLIFNLYGSPFVLAQEITYQIGELYDNETAEFYSVAAEIPDDILQKWLDQNKAVDVEFNLNEKYWEDHPYKLKDKKGKWSLLSNYLVKNVGPYDSLNFPNQMLALGLEYMIVKDKDMYFFMYLYHYETNKKLGKYKYDNLVLKEAPEMLTDEGYYDDPVYSPLWLASKDGKWGRVLPNMEEVFVLEPFIYDKPTDVPLINYNEYVIHQLPELREKNKVGRLYPIDRYGIYWKAENSETGKVGLYSGEGSLSEMVPMNFDSIQYHNDRQITATWLNGKVGYYSDTQLVKQPEFDDLKIIHIDYDYAVGLKNEDKWQMYDADKGELMFEEKAATTDELLEKWLNRFNK